MGNSFSIKKSKQGKDFKKQTIKNVKVINKIDFDEILEEEKTEIKIKREVTNEQITTFLKEQKENDLIEFMNNNLDLYNYLNSNTQTALLKSNMIGAKKRLLEISQLDDTASRAMWSIIFYNKDEEMIKWSMENTLMNDIFDGDEDSLYLSLLMIPTTKVGLMIASYEYLDKLLKKKYINDIQELEKSGKIDIDEYSVVKKFSTLFLHLCKINVDDAVIAYILEKEKHNKYVYTECDKVIDALITWNKLDIYKVYVDGMHYVYTHGGFKDEDEYEQQNVKKAILSSICRLSNPELLEDLLIRFQFEDADMLKEYKRSTWNMKNIIHKYYNLEDVIFYINKHESKIRSSEDIADIMKSVCSLLAKLGKDY